jgi:3-oxoacyl-[acyl-carrier protein] reductase
VTGAASGIGAATARVFAEAGASVALAWFPGEDHNVEPVRAAVEAAGSKCLVAEIDVTDPRQVDAVFASAVSELGSLDIVVANAGIARKVELEDLDDDAVASTSLPIGDEVDSTARPLHCCPKGRRGWVLRES